MLSTCIRCIRPLKAPRSQRIGAGWVCARQLRLDSGLPARAPKGWSALTDERVRAFLMNPFLDTSIPAEHRPILTIPTTFYRTLAQEGVDAGELPGNVSMHEAFTTKNDDPKIKAIFEKLNAKVETLMNAEEYKRYLTFATSFRQYSFLNTLAIFAQRPNASAVAGFNTWKGLNRHVNKGEKGIMILAPQLVKKPAKDPSGNPILGEDGKPEIRQQCVGFLGVHVFDVSQTSGEALPKLHIEELHSNRSDELHRRLRSVVAKDVPLSYATTKEDPLLQHAYGYYSQKENKIVIGNQGSLDDQTNTLIHEYTHWFLHRVYNEKGQLEASKIVPSNQREVEAESVAYMVASAFGLDTEKMSVGYISRYMTRDPHVLRTSMERIQRAANYIIDKIEQASSPSA